MSLEELDCPLVLFRGRSRGESAEVSASPCAGVNFSRVQPVRTGLELPNHAAVPSLQDKGRSHAGARNMPPERVKELAPVLIPNKDTEVVTYCAGPTCHASADVARTLMALGYTNVRHFAGGKQDWRRGQTVGMGWQHRQGAAAHG